MTRHARNATAGTVYTYHERKKDTSSSGYGSDKIRLGKDSIKEFDCCCLTLQPCKDPMVTQDGYLYDKEAILEYFVQKKREIARKLKEYQKQKTKLQKEQEELKRAEQESKLNSFVSKESRIVSKPIDPFKKSAREPQPSTSRSVSNMQEGKGKSLPSFWIPSLTPQAEATKIEKPEEKVRCPMSGKPLKFKDLIPVNFTLLKDKDDKRSLIAKDARYVCAVTNDILGNTVPCAVLKPSGSVVTMECVEKIIKKDMRDPICGKPLTEKDIIRLERGATGFAGAGVELKAKKDRPVLQA